jgi:hypothetical protein
MRAWVAGLAAAGAVVAATNAAADGPDWQVGPVPGAPSSCSAKLPGDDIDLILMINKDGKLVLTAGHASWNASGAFDSTLVIDGKSAGKLHVDGVGPLYLGLAPDKLAKRLRGANTLDWTLPDGTFHIATTGLGKAFDAAVACQKQAGHS